MKKVRMIKTEKGSFTGIDVFVFEAGKEYEIGKNISENLLNIFVGMKSAVEVKEEVQNEMMNKETEEEFKEERMEKMVEEAPQNKAIESAPDNKKDKKAFLRDKLRNRK